MKLPSEIRFVDEKIKEAFYKLKKGDKSEQELFNVINNALDKIEENAFCGVQIQKHLMPKIYAQKYNVENLWKFDLPKGWRLIYSIKDDKLIVVSIVIEWFDHKDYEKRFRY